MMESSALVFLVGLCVGAILALLLHQSEIKTLQHFNQQNTLYKDLKITPKYVDLSRRVVPDDLLAFTDYTGNLESDLLYDKVNVLCVVSVMNSKSLRPINDTWAKNCNERLYYTTNLGERLVGVERLNGNSSWHIFCNILQRISHDYHQSQWILFIDSETYVVPENLRYIVAAMNASEPHYLGHPISYRGFDLNVASAGIALSRGAVELLVKQFPNSTVCTSGETFWNREDFYLGEKLNELGVKPMDTRDENKLSTFMGYNLDSMMNPGSNLKFSQYYTNSLLPVKCCSSRAVTFKVTAPETMYTIYYAIYRIKVFTRFSENYHPAPTSEDPDAIWQNFLKSIGKPLNVTPQEYRRLWVLQIAKDIKSNKVDGNFYDEMYKRLVEEVQNRPSGIE